ncbi:MAG: hypothetical protein ACLFVU_11440 [Phycisphaerae bacterium]
MARKLNRQNLLIATLILIAPLLMLPAVWLSPVSAGEDDLIYYYPLRKMVGEDLQAGRWPGHNSREAGGLPLMGDPQSALMYPPTLLFGVTDAKIAYRLNIFIAFWIAGFGTWAYMRRIGLVPAACAFGAIGVMFSGFFIGHRVHLSMISAAAFLPWWLWSVETFRQRKWLQAFAVLCPATFLALAAGHWPTAILMGLIFGGYFLLRGRPVLPSLGTAGGAMALAAAAMSPQIMATWSLMQSVTRQRIGYAMFGENSFFPSAWVLSVFPMVFGTRTPNLLYPQTYWGPWHLCEMLGYVGLITLILAGATVLVMFRRKRLASERRACSESGLAPEQLQTLEMHRLVRTWTFLAAVAGVWMLGYYLPTYRLVHMIPVLGVVRCPARMLLAMDFALVTLAAIGIHLLSQRFTKDELTRKLTFWIRLGSTRILPVVMLIALGVVALHILLPLPLFFRIDAMSRITWGSMAWSILIPILLLLITAVVAWRWVSRSGRGSWILVALLAVDLLTVSAFVDSPYGDPGLQDPDESLAADYLQRRYQDTERRRIWGMGPSYSVRASEFLRPKTAQAMGFRTINSYGPFLNPDLAQLYGFRIFGTNTDTRRLVRTNHLLSMAGVRFLIVPEGDRSRLVEIVALPEATGTGEQRSTGPLTLGEPKLTRAEANVNKSGGTTFRLRAPAIWRPSSVRLPLPLSGEGPYRIRLDAKGPDGGAASFLAVEVPRKGFTFYIPAEQIAPEWRHFECTVTGSDRATGGYLHLFTIGERPILVRNITIKPAEVETPVLLPQQRIPADLEPGRPIYRKLAVLPAQDPAEPDVVIFENRLFDSFAHLPDRRVDNEYIEKLKWQPETITDLVRPDVSIPETGNPRHLLTLTIPAIAAYLLIVVVGTALLRRRRSREP